MNWYYIGGLAIGLAMDAFAVAVASGLALRKVTFRQTFRLAWHFGLFQFMMPIVGWYLGSTISTFVEAFDHWLAFGLLSLIGGRIMHEAGGEPHRRRKANPTKGWMLVALSIATSIDALAVGLSMAFLRVAVWLPSLVIGIVACAFTAAGISIGARVSSAWSKAAHVLGGLTLIAIGAHILMSHLR